MHSSKFMTISTRTDVLKYSFFPRTLIDWNHIIDGDIVSATTVPSFKEWLRNYQHCCSIDFYPFSVNAWIRLCWSSPVEVEIDGRYNKSSRHTPYRSQQNNTRAHAAIKHTMLCHTIHRNIATVYPFLTKLKVRLQIKSNSGTLPYKCKKLSFYNNV